MNLLRICFRRLFALLFSTFTHIFTSRCTYCLASSSVLTAFTLVGAITNLHTLQQTLYLKPAFSPPETPQSQLPGVRPECRSQAQRQAEKQSHKQGPSNASPGNCTSTMRNGSGHGYAESYSSDKGDSLSPCKPTIAVSVTLKISSPYSSVQSAAP